MHHQQGMPVESIADAMNMSVEAVTQICLMTKQGRKAPTLDLQEEAAKLAPGALRTMQNLTYLEEESPGVAQRASEFIIKLAHGCLNPAERESEMTSAVFNTVIVEANSNYEKDIMRLNERISKGQPVDV
mgnify:FL=1